MPEQTANKKIAEKTEVTLPEASMETPVSTDHRPVELEFDEADAVFGKRTRV
jgi:hypothetical protein